MKTTSAMFQRTILVAIFFAASTSALPGNPPPLECSDISERLRTALRPLDPYTFSNISLFPDSYDNSRLLYNFINLTFEGFSSVNCEYFNTFENDTALLTLNGTTVEFSTNHLDVHGLLDGQYISEESPSPFRWEVNDYRLALRFRYQYNSSSPLSHCITDGSLEMTPGRGDIDIFDRRLLLHYLPRFANVLSTTLNETFCEPADAVQTVPPPIPTTTIASEPSTPGPGPGSGCCGVSSVVEFFDCCHDLGHNTSAAAYSRPHRSTHRRPPHRPRPGSTRRPPPATRPPRRPTHGTTPATPPQHRPTHGTTPATPPPHRPTHGTTPATPPPHRPTHGTTPATPPPPTHGTTPATPPPPPERNCCCYFLNCTT